MQRGSIVKSLSGHDKGWISVVVKAEQNRVWIADGKHRTLAKPKAKNPVHLEVLGETERIPQSDADLRRICKRS